MRLAKIKLAGFKSFVDPTQVSFPNDLTAIVGPNGCGKSNVIDAVRWVMGESSAKHLRTSEMADVIFNGSSARKPVGQAAVELIFDNSQGKLDGPYAQFSEISIKRQVSRDGQSFYALNGVRCRRRDIVDIFLGTGLGPRSYAIIEQGMIARLIEAKPDELRVYLEETAGISKYKERRRETESRMQQTQENLSRVLDLIEEHGKQVRHLEKQAAAAEKYKQYKETLDRLEAEHLALKWRELEGLLQGAQQKLGQHELNLEAAQTDLHRTDADIETVRAQYEEAHDNLQEVQGRYYTANGDVTRIEQALSYQRERKEQLQLDHQDALQHIAELNQRLHDDNKKLNELEAEIASLMPSLNAAQQELTVRQEAYNNSETEMQAWQAEWQTFNQTTAKALEEIRVQQTQREHLKHNIEQAKNRLAQIEKLDTDLQGGGWKIDLNIFRNKHADLEHKITTARSALDETLQLFTTQKDSNIETEKMLHETREKLQNAQKQAATLSALQEISAGQDHEKVKHWLTTQNLQKILPLFARIEVVSGWENAIETVLGQYLEAVPVSNVSSYAESISKLDHGRLVLLNENTPTSGWKHTFDAAKLLRQFLTSKGPLPESLNYVYYAHSLGEALSMSEQLAPHESVITQEGVWLGPGWLRFARKKQDKDSVVLRQNTLNALLKEIDKLADDFESQKNKLEQGKARLQALESTRDEQRKKLTEVERTQAEVRAEERALETGQQAVLVQQAQMETERAEMQTALQSYQSGLQTAQERLHVLEQAASLFDGERHKLQERREVIATALTEVKGHLNELRTKVNELTVQSTRLSSHKEAIDTQITRMQDQKVKLDARAQQMQTALGDSDKPLQTLQAELEEAVQQRVAAEKILQTARQRLDEVAHQLREHEQDRVKIEQKVQGLRQTAEQARLQMQGLQIKRETIEEGLTARGCVVQTVLENLSPDAQEIVWAEDIAQLNEKIRKLGAINLAAIEEYTVAVERFDYLNRQNDDLNQALATLQQAIDKIDIETRTRFQETFDLVNKGLSEYFTQVFGGGEAFLELTSDDFLNAGVVMMARPPGKRNSTIHALSGGEKTLSALSLVFALFRLTPAPFCMLDEVDAPLDDANIGRFCRLVKEMSSQVQFIFITHNKHTMELAEQLIGVTMKEPGVSRLVSVNVNEAMEAVEKKK